MKFALREASPEIKVAVLGLAVLFGVAAFSRGADAVDALADVNAIREANGLPLYVRDDGLTQAASRTAAFRAEHFLFGHTPSDFQFLPAGSHADAAGCAAYPPDHGFMACAMFDDYQYGGAAYVMGADGKAYCHLFVRGGSGRTLGQRNFNFRRPLTGHLDKQASAKPAAAACPAGGCAPASVYHSERHTVVHREGVVMPVANVVGFFQTRQPAREFVRRLAGRR